MGFFFMGGKAEYERIAKIYEIMGSDPIIRNNLEFNDLTVHEQQEDGWKRLKRLQEIPGDFFFRNCPASQQELHFYC